MIELPSKIISNVNQMTNVIRDQYTQAVFTWCQNIRTTIDQELKKKPDEAHALNILDYWKNRSVVLNILTQECT